MAEVRIKRVLEGGTPKKWLMFGVAVIAIVAAVVYFTQEEPISDTRLRGPTNGINATQGGAPVSEAYNEALAEADRQRREEALRTGGSALPTVRGQDEDIVNPIIVEEPAPVTVETPKPVIVAKPLNIETTYNTPPPVMPVQPMRQVDEKALGDFLAQMQSMVANPGAANVAYYHEGLEEQVDASQDPQMIANVGTGVDPDVPLAGTILYGEMLNRANSDAPGPVLARILQGPLTGATLIGEFQVGQDALVITFNRMKIEDPKGRDQGRVVEINAVAVDTRYIGTALATKVNRHLFQKIAFAASTAFLQGLGQAIANSGTTTTINPIGGVTQTTPELDFNEQLLVAGGAAAGQTGRVLNDIYGNRPTTVIVDMGTPIGLLFL